MNNGIVSGGTGGDVSGLYLIGTIRLEAIYPGDAIVVERVASQVLEAEDGRDNSGHCNKQQQGTRKLVSKFPHTPFWRAQAKLLKVFSLALAANC
jgi:hypothetical protein